ncbi:50S ribosomal protein L3 N(5)-glutamine methyltransferase [Pseudidiomarina mangrovi]|uniref:50S ribosomal protein L3 N(5)-glutamine methyltransferase n=1 Tax=Pseudidiomarina mangrovi TaxID=2487133 RepID=UPI001F0C30FF|nr:50S ribosomal protein L3 N(5)-glutamine methyltransferase [Pseudidiomarina mangrovi]
MTQTHDLALYQHDISHLRSIADLWRFSVSALQQADVYFGHGTDNAVSEAQVLLAHVCHLDFSQLQQFAQAQVLDSEREQLQQLLQQRIEQRVPAAYLTGTAWFNGLPIMVDERVLVPRSPIAELIAGKFAPYVSQPPQRILDLCTGSGCIAIACALAFPDADVDALDISSDALEVAEANILAHGLGDRVVPMQSDLYSAVPGMRYDLIVTNPPYVDAQDMADLPDEFHHEPELGLAAGEDGLDLVRTILREAPDHLTEQGVLICEVGNSMVAMQQEFVGVPFTWLTFSNGGDGVFMIRYADLVTHQQRF